jgi:hypothetical protein
MDWAAKPEAMCEGVARNRSLPVQKDLEAFTSNDDIADSKGVIYMLPHFW